MPKNPFRPRFPWRRLLVALAFLGAVGTSAYGCMIHMPGRSVKPPLPPLDASESGARERLQADLQALGDIGERHMGRPDALERAAQLIEGKLREAGHAPVRRTYEVDRVPCSNLEATIPGKSDEVLVVGAHYDSARGSPGANDNGSGVIALIELARRLRGVSPERTVALVFFVNEEPPYFATEKMGSRVWANDAHQRGARIAGAISLETMGFYTEAPDSQKYPFPMGAFYPGEGYFLAFVGNVDSRDLIQRSVGSFREVATLPSEGAAMPDKTPALDWSDHASFWRHGWPGLMVTDTAPFRYPYYHTHDDTPDKVDTAALARAVIGLEHVLRSLSGAK
jgi:hypothetical protein